MTPHDQLRNLLCSYLPIMGGVFLTLISWRIIGRSWKIADPDLEEVWVDSLKVMRFGGPALILIGACAVAYLMLNS